MSKVRQGVTTEVIGNCGYTPYPLVTWRRTCVVQAQQAGRVGLEHRIDLFRGELQGQERRLHLLRGFAGGMVSSGGAARKRLRAGSGRLLGAAVGGVAPEGSPA